MVQTHKLIDDRPYLHLQRPLWDTCAISYCLLAYGTGLFLITRSQMGLNAIGVIFLTHALIYSAYLSHEFMHGNIFRHRQWDTAFGLIMLWLNGGCYFGFKALALQHLEHHVHRADVLTFDIPKAICQQPKLIRQCILGLEWCHFPIIAFWARWRAIALLWQTAQSARQRLRIATIFVIRTTLFTLLGITNLRGLVLYFVSYLGMMAALRWMDTFQHTYEGFASRAAMPKHNFDYEQKHTFSNLLSSRYPIINLIFLNFGYHNAHHAVMQCPWHSLQELDKDLRKLGRTYQISLYQQFRNYHRFRITRLLEGQGSVIDNSGKVDFTHFYGAADVSFITLY